MRREQRFSHEECSNFPCASTVLSNSEVAAGRIPPDSWLKGRRKRGRGGAGRNSDGVGYRNNLPIAKQGIRVIKNSGLFWGIIERQRYYNASYQNEGETKKRPSRSQSPHPIISRENVRNVAGTDFFWVGPAHNVPFFSRCPSLVSSLVLSLALEHCGRLWANVTLCNPTG